VPALEEWVTDPDRFPELWIRAASETLRRARGGADGAQG
jgi:hypothetical protein